MSFVDDYSPLSQWRKKTANAEDFSLFAIPIKAIKMPTKPKDVEYIYSSTATEDPNFVA